MNKICEHCLMPRTKAGHDPCIADLPGVFFACCGHAGTAGFKDKSGPSTLPYLIEALPQGTLYGDVALERMRELGGSPPDHPGLDPEVEKILHPEIRSRMKKSAPRNLEEETGRR